MCQIYPVVLVCLYRRHKIPQKSDQYKHDLLATFQYHYSIEIKFHKIIMYFVLYYLSTLIFHKILH